MRLYHFTCDHGAKFIRLDREIRPNLHPYLGESFVWLTPLASPKPRDIGLHRVRLQCDRMAHRFEVETDQAVPWSAVRDQFGDWEVQQLERSPGAKPSLWYVSRVALPLVPSEPVTEFGELVTYQQMTESSEPEPS